MEFEKHAFGIGVITGLFLSRLDTQLAHFLQSLLWPIWSLEMNEVDFTNLVKAVKALAEPNGAEIASAIGTFLSVAMSSFLSYKAYKTKKQTEIDIENLNRIEQNFREVKAKLFDESKRIPINKREHWFQAANLIKQSINLFTKIKSSDFKYIIKKEKKEWLKSNLEHGDQRKNSLRMQFFTGLEKWHDNEDPLNKIIESKKINIGSSFSEFDAFGNTDKNIGISNIAIENIITVYAFMLGYEEIEVEDLKKIWIDEPEKHKHIWPKDSCRGFHRFFLDYFEATRTE